MVETKTGYVVAASSTVFAGKHYLGVVGGMVPAAVLFGGPQKDWSRVQSYGSASEAQAEADKLSLGGLWKASVESV